MVFKINISDKSGKTYKFELESEELIGKSVGDKLDGKELLPGLEGYELELTGTSDKAGFPSLPNVEGSGLKRVLLSYEKGMKTKPKGERKKKYDKTPKGLRLRKTVRGKILSADTIQINLKVVKEGKEKLSEVFSDQNKPKEESKPEEKPVEKSEEKTENNEKKPDEKIDNKDIDKGVDNSKGDNNGGQESAEMGGNKPKKQEVKEEIKQEEKKE